MYKNSDLLLHGIALVPIPLGHKGPISKGWNEKSNVVTHVANESLLTGLNIGIAHAYCTPNPACAIDLDDYKASKKWLADKGVNLDALLYSPDAVVIHSGKVNSLKLIYRLPSGMPPMPSKSIKNPDKTMMIEFRCASAQGLTVQDVLPPSMHPSGTQYKFIGSGSILALPMIPVALIKVWNELINANKSAKKTQIARTLKPETPREVARVKEMLSHISADCAYDIYRDAVWAILSTEWVCAVDIAKEWCETAPELFNETSFWSVVNSYSSDVPKPITLGTLHHFARAGGWNG
jgi:putative DNA primase/helicase